MARLDEVDVATLKAVGREVVNMLRAARFTELGEKYGYALSFGRSPSDAIQSDWNERLSNNAKNSGNEPQIKVTYLEPNDSNLYAVVECFLPATSGNAGLIELVVTSKDRQHHICIEQIESAP
jgi:hypothetical protein